MSDYTSFHGDFAVKEKYLTRVERHMAADQLVRGMGWDGSKGCAVGCTLEAYEHALYETELGIPEWLARLEDELFEGMSELKSRTWPKDFLATIPLSVSPDRFEREVKAPFLVFLLDQVRLTFDHSRFPDVLTVLDRSRALWLRDDIGSDEWKAEAARAAKAARSTWAARVAGAAAGAAGAAAGAAEAVREVAWAAEAAARAARAARAAVYDQYADELLRLLRALGEEG